MSKPIRLPQLATLQAFESSARLGNFTAAAHELDSTQSAISQHIKRLEKELGVPLFLRAYRGVELTDAGSLLLSHITKGLDHITEGLQAVQKQREHTLINVGTDYAIAAYWLLPLLSKFRAAHNQVEVRVVAGQKSVTPDESNVDIAILFGDGQFGRSPSRLLMHESVTPVCSPVLVDKLGPLRNPQDMNRFPLLKLEAEHQEKWFTWERLFHKMGIDTEPREPDLVLNNYTLLLQAAVAGQGVAIGWNPMCDAMIESGVLVPLTPDRIQSQCGYYLVLPATKKITPTTQLFCDWLIEEAKRS